MNKILLSFLLIASIFTGPLVLADIYNLQGIPSIDTYHYSTYEVLARAGTFKTLVSAIDKAGLTNYLKTDAGPLTLFAPTDQAFAAMNKIKLQDILNDTDRLRHLLEHHIAVGQRLSTRQLEGLNTINLWNGTVSVGAHGTTISGARIIKPDITTSNGIIQVINKVLEVGN